MLSHYHLNSLSVHRATALAGLALACWLSAGCRGSDDPEASLAPPLQPPVAAQPLPTSDAPEANHAQPDVDEPAPNAEQADNASEQAYEPPFPDRVDLFVAPKRQGRSRETGSTSESIELLGFVTVDKPRAVLSIDGQVAPVAQGDAKFGVEVIAIEPPTVVLQRGRNRWQASIDN